MFTKFSFVVFFLKTNVKCQKKEKEESIFLVHIFNLPSPSPSPSPPPFPFSPSSSPSSYFLVIAVVMVMRVMISVWGYYYNILFGVSLPPQCHPSEHYQFGNFVEPI